MIQTCGWCNCSATSFRKITATTCFGPGIVRPVVKLGPFLCAQGRGLVSQPATTMGASLRRACEGASVAWPKAWSSADRSFASFRFKFDEFGEMGFVFPRMLVNCTKLSSLPRNALQDSPPRNNWYRSPTRCFGTSQNSLQNLLYSVRLQVWKSPRGGSSSLASLRRFLPREVRRAVPADISPAVSLWAGMAARLEGSGSLRCLRDLQHHSFAP